MNRTFHLGGLVCLATQAAATAAFALPVTYQFSISHPRYGAIGTYDRTVDTIAGVTHAQSRLRVAVRIFGLVVHRETAGQDETWNGPRLVAFRSVSVTNGKRLDVGGEARGAGFAVSTPAGTETAPGDVAASDPFSLPRLGSGTVVSIRTGKIDHVQVTGGEVETVVVRGAPASARHFHVSTSAQADKWEVWITKDGVPLRFRTIEPGGRIEFILTSPTPPATGAGNALAFSQPGSAARGP
jgi:hypothetical protein